MKIAQIGTSDRRGGAAAVALGLQRGYKARGHQATYFVGRRTSTDPAVAALPDEDAWPWRLSGYTTAQRALRALARRHGGRGFGLASRALRLGTHPRALGARVTGSDDFLFPAATRAVTAFGADVIHAHNLHGGYFDLNSLTRFSERHPVVITLHDMWLLTGHCAHAVDCSRWRSGCGSCPDLRREPAIARDATAANLRRKRDIVERSRVHAVAPSRWMHDQIAGSMLAPYLQSVRVIPNGVDTAVFRPGDRLAARARLNLPGNAFVVLLTTGGLGSMWKDDAMLRRAIDELALRPPDRPLIFLAVGRDLRRRGTAGVDLRTMPFQASPEGMAAIFQAADLYWQASLAETFPLAVLESMACGTPVVATRVGGIPEQVGPATGVLVEAGDATGMAAASLVLLENHERRADMGRQAAADVAARFTLAAQVDAYLDCYGELLS